jgi:hypothetical protein
VRGRHSSIARIIPGTPSLTQQRVRQPTPAYVVEELRQLAVSSLLPGAGVVLNMVQPAAEQSMRFIGSTGSASPG